LDDVRKPPFSLVLGLVPGFESPHAHCRTSSFACFIFSKIVYADVAELADALVLGSSGHPVQVQVLSSADYEEALIFGAFSHVWEEFY
jgi:hypothetical protein